MSNKKKKIVNKIDMKMVEKYLSGEMYFTWYVYFNKDKNKYQISHGHLLTEDGDGFYSVKDDHTKKIVKVKQENMVGSIQDAINRCKELKEQSK